MGCHLVDEYLHFKGSIVGGVEVDGGDLKSIEEGDGGVSGDVLIEKGNEGYDAFAGGAARSQRPRIYLIVPRLNLR